MNSCITESLDRLFQENKMDQNIVLWGVGSQTPEILEWFDQHTDINQRIIAIADNFKYTFWKQYRDIPVIPAKDLRKMDQSSMTVLLAMNYSEAVRRQLEAYEIKKFYNLRDLSEEMTEQTCDLPYYFTDRSMGKKYLCYILAGYEPELYDNTLERVRAFHAEEFDYCIITSGKYEANLEKLASKYNWSYLYTEQNQICYIQNLVIELHPEAEYIIKMDEDIFIGKNFFRRMTDEFHNLEEKGDYRIGFAVPVIPLNCCGYVSYLKLAGEAVKDEYEKRFGRAYKSRFSAVLSVEETSEFLWDTMDTFDHMASKFLENKGYDILDCYFNIGCIMFSRERWLLMGKWPENWETSGMGEDEAYINQDNTEKDMTIYEIHSVLAGHLAFGPQKQRMHRYYKENKKKFMMEE